MGAPVEPIRISDCSTVLDQCTYRLGGRGLSESFSTLLFTSADLQWCCTELAAMPEEAEV